MAKIYLMRHGETNYNVEERMTGRGSDPELTNHGKSQANLVGASLKTEYQISYIVSSNMTRTNQTAEIINQHLGLDIHYDNEIQEKDKGGLEGTLISESLPIILTLKDDETHPVYGGESDAIFRNRIVNALCKYLISEEEAILLVSHGFVGTMAARTFLNVDTNFNNAHFMTLDPEQIPDLAGKCSFDCSTS